MFLRRNKSKLDLEERFRRWHWGIDSLKTIDIKDPRFPDEMVEIGKLLELRIKRPIKGNREEDISIEITDDHVNKSYVLFDHNHKYDRIYLYIPSSVKKKMKTIYKDMKDQPIFTLEELRSHVEGHHSKKSDYPNVKVKPLGYLTHICYFTHKKGDGPSGYIHEMGEEAKGVLPIVGVSSDGNIWLVGGSYTCPYAGITN